MYKIKKLTRTDFYNLKQKVKHKLSSRWFTIHEWTTVYYTDTDKYNFKFKF